MHKNYIILLKTCRLENTVQLFIYIYIYIYVISFKSNNSLEINLRIKQKNDRLWKYIPHKWYILVNLCWLPQQVCRPGQQIFRDRCKEYLYSFINNNNCSKFAQLHLQNSHSFWKTENIMQILHFNTKKSSY
jgi:hypothetical protein